MFTKSDTHNINYLALITKITNLRPHPNADRLKICSIFGNTVITGNTAQDNDPVIYFPIESAISREFLSYTNSFEDKTLNADITKKGFFNNHGRVRAINLRGQKSEGYIIPVHTLVAFAKDVLGKTIVIDETYEGLEFDLFLDHLLVKKYVPANQRVPSNTVGKKSKGNVKKYASKLVENQFQFHQDTAAAKRNIHRINPDDYISITNKLHGSNFIVSNVLIKKKLSWKDRLAKFFGANIWETEYGNLYASRTIIKNRNFETANSTGHYYDVDIWKIASDRLFPLLKEGISITGELVGYTPSGKCIQPSYDYGCSPGELDMYVFKVTYTSPSGTVYTFSPRETVEWCKQHGVKTPETFYYGKAKDLFPDLDITQHWHDNFLQKLEETFLEKKCDICKNDVWAEGIVIRPDIPFDWLAFKLKSWNFLGYESTQLDAGVGDFEGAVTDESDPHGLLEDLVFPKL